MKKHELAGMRSQPMTPKIGVKPRAYDVVADKNRMCVPFDGRWLRLPSWKEAKHGSR